MSNGADVTSGRSLVVETRAVLPVLAAPLVIPRSVIVSVSPGNTTAPLNSPHVEHECGAGIGAAPTSTLRPLTWTTPPCQPGAVVPVGRLTVIWLPASAMRDPPVVETVKPMA